MPQKQQTLCWRKVSCSVLFNTYLVTKSTTAAEKVKDSVLKVKVKAEELANSIKADKSIAEGQLEAARPALEEGLLKPYNRNYYYSYRCT